MLIFTMPIVTTMEPEMILDSITDFFGSIVASAFGGLDILLQSLLWLMVLDVIAGSAVAVYLRKSRKTKSGGFSWVVFRKGIIQKLMMLAVVIVANLIDTALAVEMLRQVVCLFYIAEEALSVLDNAERLGLPLPHKLVQVLQVLEEETGSEEYDDETLDSVRKRAK